VLFNNTVSRNNMQRGAKQYPLPEFLKNKGITQDKYGKWLDKITTPHLKRDRKRLKCPIDRKIYRAAIHKAVCSSHGKDYYTGLDLDWKLLNHFADIPTKETTKGIKRPNQEKVPTVDHENLSATKPTFRICSLMTNKCKSDYSLKQLIWLAEALLRKQKQC
jgi:hypothetical protein